MARFIIDIDSDRSLDFELTKTRTLIGRSSASDLQLPDRRCSRQHAEVIHQGGEFVIRDLDSKNRTHVNGEALEAERALKHGDRVRIGDMVLIFDAGSGVERDEITFEDSSNIRLVDDEETRWGQTRATVAAGPHATRPVKLERNREQPLSQPLHRLEILYDIADKIRSILDLNRLLEEIADVLAKVLTPDSLALMLFDENDGELRPRIARSSHVVATEIRISRSIVDQCVADRLSILVSDAAQDKRFSASESIVAHRIRSAMCAPLIHQDDVLGVVYVDSKSATLPYQQDELELVTGIVNQAATAIANARLHERLLRQQRLEREMEIARTIQVNLLPREAPDLPGLDVWGISEPAAQVGGDYFDYVRRGPDELAVAIADVSGKGVPAALLTAILRASLRIFAADPASGVLDIISRLNRTICRDVTDNMFVSAVVGLLDAPTRRFTYANAGHCHPLLFRPEGRVDRLDVGGIFLGLLTETEYQTQTVDLPPGSTLVLYTDGLTDMVNTRDELFGSERLLASIRRNLTQTAQDLCENVFEELRQFSNGASQFDDCTLVVIKS